MDKTLVIDIDIDNIKKGIKDISKIQTLVEQALDDAILELQDRLLSKLNERIIFYGLGDSQLINTISVSKVQDGISIKVGAEYANFIEFGTGIVGKENPHPQLDGWIYDTKNNGNTGWWYPTTASDPNPYKWVDGSGQLRAWTKGSQSKPFMYDTWKYGKRIATKTVNKHINKRLKEIAH